MNHVDRNAMNRGVVNRRDLIKAGGALVISCAALPLAAQAQGAAAAAKPPLVPTELDSFLSIGGDGTVTGFVGKTDVGHGTGTAIGQIIAEELDVPLDRVKVLFGDTANTVNQGGASSSNAVSAGGRQLRLAAAEARRVLLDMAAVRLNIGVDKLMVSDGVVTVAGEPAKNVSYADLIGGRYFDVKLDWNGQYGNDLNAAGKAKPKSPAQYTIVGEAIPSADVPGKVFGTTLFVTDVRRPGMLHGRMIRPNVAGAIPVAIDESSIESIGGARVVRVKDLIGVVAEDEWAAIRAARALKVGWSDAKPPFPPIADLYDHIRSAPTVLESAANMFQGKVAVDERPFNEAVAKAAKVVEREYEYPFQSHASMGPAAALVEIVDGKVTLWTGSQKPHFAREGIALQLGVPVENVHAIWVPGPGSYGRNDAGDAAFDAAILAQATGRPVRVQYMRHEGTGWDPKGPAAVMQMKAGLDQDGHIVAHRFKARGFSSWTVLPWELAPSETLAGMLTGATPNPKDNFGTPRNSYKFPVSLAFFQTIAPLMSGASPLRTSQFRAPQTPQCLFGAECFIDELAFEAGVDPVEFRLRYIKEPRDIAAFRAAVDEAGWEARSRPRLRARDGLLLGQGVAYTVHAGTVVVAVADIEIDPKSGRLWPRRFTVAHDCGLIINPLGVTRTIEGNIVMATSRALFEEVKFTPENVTSVDWESYPILEMRDAPEAIDVILLNRRDLPTMGAGEPATGVVAPAIANAIFDATGKRLRRAPFTPAAILSLLA
jgi:nicotinate dehydrogenase subunit B